MKKFTESHEWVEVDGSVGTVGITDYAQKELGEIVYVELPEVGTTMDKGDEAVVLESTKAAADVYTPVAGKVLEINNTLIDNSEMVNRSPEGDGWLFKVELADFKNLEGLMELDAYEKMVQ